MSTAEAPKSAMTPAAEDREAREAASGDEQPRGAGLLAKGKRKLLGLGKKQEGDAADAAADKSDKPTTTYTMSPTSAPTLLPSPPLTTSPPPGHRSPRGSPRIYPAGINVGASPSRRINRSSSPGLHSPASSQIFERNVQEPEPSPAIPAHIKTEDHIPAALDASSLAITDDHLNPDEVEIVMHSAHQPASAVVAGSMTDSLHSPSLAHEEASFLSHTDLSDSASNANYASLDTTDVRRLSFISFADVVQAEHAETDRDGTQFVSLSTTANRSPSPMRSPTSSHGFNASPPRSGATSEKGPGSPTAHGTHSPPLGGSGELQIETMRQALRRTGSGDLSGARSQPLSAASVEETAADRAPFK